jgi:hypothetical protein
VDYMKMYSLIREPLHRLVLMGRITRDQWTTSLLSVRNGKPDGLAVAAYNAVT